MRRFVKGALAGVVLAGALAGCAVQTSPVDTARFNASPVWLAGDPDIWAINQAQWAFADPGRTLNRPAEAARAVAALDYLAGQINTSPRWAMIGPHSKMELLQARVETRAALGIAPDAPSQAVVDAMMAAGDALNAGDPHGAMASLHGPGFTQGPDQILHSLTAMPYLRTANIATIHAASELHGDGGIGVRWR